MLTVRYLAEMKPLVVASQREILKALFKVEGSSFIFKNRPCQQT